MRFKLKFRHGVGKTLGQCAFLAMTLNPLLGHAQAGERASTETTRLGSLGDSVAQLERSATSGPLTVSAISDALRVRFFRVPGPKDMRRFLADVSNDEGLRGVEIAEYHSSNGAVESIAVTFDFGVARFGASGNEFVPARGKCPSTELFGDEALREWAVELIIANHSVRRAYVRDVPKGRIRILPSPNDLKGIELCILLLQFSFFPK